MANVRGTHSGLCGRLGIPSRRERSRRRPAGGTPGKWLLLALLIFLAQVAFAQGKPQVTAVDPGSGKVNDSVTLTGENLGKESVSSVFLSDDNNDYKATVVEQAGAKIVMKVPQVKPGDYHVSIQVGDKIFILPLRFKVE
jgi:IPT/TIG domain-containing protein